MNACRLLLAATAAMAWDGVASAQLAPYVPSHSHGPGVVVIGDGHHGVHPDESGPRSHDALSRVIYDGHEGHVEAPVHEGHLHEGHGLVHEGHGPVYTDHGQYVDGHHVGGHYVNGGHHADGHCADGQCGIPHSGHWGHGHEWVEGECFGEYGDCCAHRWDVRVGWIAMKRVANEARLVQFNANPAGIGFVDTINARDFDYDYAPGGDASVIFHVDSCNAVEFRYMFFDDSIGEVRRVITAGAVPPPGFGGGFGGAFQPGIPSVAVVTGGVLSTFERPVSAVVTGEIRSDISSGEINVRSQTCCGHFTWIGGFRYIDLNEKLTIIGAGDLGRQFIWKTDNDMFGFQAGTEIAFAPVNDCFRFDGLFKGGVYYNEANSEVFDSGVTGVGPRQIESGEDQVSFVGEAGLFATWQFSRIWSLRAGYQAFWLHSVAAAQDQVFTTGQLGGTFLPLTHDTDAESNVIYHGANVGFIAEF